MLKRKIIIASVILSIVGCTNKKSENSAHKKQTTIPLLVGTYTSESSEGIYSLDFNVNDGSLSNQKLVAKTENPSFLDLSKDGNEVFSVNENDPGTISAFHWNENKTALKFKEILPTEGKHPCYIELNKAENLLAVANYSSGNIAVYTIDDGKPSKPVQVRNHEGNSPVNPNQDVPHAHCSKFTDDGKFLYVADLGIDEIVGYAIDGQQELGEQFTALKMDAGDGPRHFVFHPTKNLVFIVSEFSNTVTVASINSETGILTKIDKQSTLPESHKEESYSADIQISSDGKYLYASNRGHNSIAPFSIAEDGTIKLLETVSVEGDWPRNFTLSPDENFLLIANQKSDNITVFKRNQKTGVLTFTGNELKISKPVCIKFN